MAITMVLADDEPFALKSEEMFLRREFPQVQIVGTAEDGIALKRMLETLNPDIALIDIRMPGLTGLEVAQMLSHQGRVHTHFIVHTAYSDFEYIKQALDLKLDGYLLKPSKREEKLETFGRLFRLVEEEKQQRKEQDALNNALSLVNPVLGSEIVRSVISGSGDEKGFLSYCAINQVEFLGGAAAVFVPEKHEDLEEKTVDAAVRESLLDLCRYFSAVTKTGVVLLFLLEREQDLEMQKNICEDLAFLVSQKLEEFTGRHFLYGVGGCYPQFSRMHASYREAAASLNQAQPLGSRSEKGVSSEKAEMYLEAAKSYIQANFRRDISLSDCAQETGISPYYLSHLFREQSGETFIEYLSRVRIEEAKRLALRTELPIRELGEKVGYQNTTYFCKVFKRMTGCTISEFRKKASC